MCYLLHFIGGRLVDELVIVIVLCTRTTLVMDVLQVMLANAAASLVVVRQDELSLQEQPQQTKYFHSTI